MVTLATPGCPIRRREDRVHLLAREKSEERAIEPLHRNREDALDRWERNRIEVRGIVKKGPQGDEAKIASPRAVSAFFLQVVEKAEDEWRVQIRQSQRHGRLARTLLRVPQEV